MPAHEFTLAHCLTDGVYTDSVYDDIKANPPSGCEPEDMGGRFSLHCQRTDRNLLEAVAQVCDEVRRLHGIALDDLAVEKVWEFVEDGRNGYGATIVGQLLLMAIARAKLLGYDVENLVEFVRTAGGDF